MKPRLPPGYHLQWDPDLLLRRRPDGSVAAAFSARGATEEAMELAAWEARRITLPVRGTLRRLPRRKAAPSPATALKILLRVCFLAALPG